MTGVLFAAVADDDTGASDLAGMLADQGVRTILVLDTSLQSDSSVFESAPEAVVLATATRALPPELAKEKTAAAMRLAAQWNPHSIEIKYCSTFDSTESGNIGPSIDAAMDVLNVPFTIAVPALPVNGRTTYAGHHFVKGQLLSDSPMRNHPLNPMTDSNLVRWLSKQTQRRVGLTPYEVVDRGADAIRKSWREQLSNGISISVVDCVTEKHASDLCEAAADYSLLSGSSVFGQCLPSSWMRRGWFAPAEGDLWPNLVRAPGRGRMVVAGSCSVATAAQNQWLSRRAATVFEVEAPSLACDELAQLVAPIADALTRNETVLLKTHSSPADLVKAQRWGADRGFSPAELGLKIAAGLADLAARAMEMAPPEALVSAGGETSSALCRRLKIGSLAVERNIEPGVPLCLPLEGRCMPIVLKSGNFGSEDFYGSAFAAAAKVQTRI
jgi:uncharacterized protein YgbK (DUF1537 family)